MRDPRKRKTTYRQRPAKRSTRRPPAKRHFHFVIPKGYRVVGFCEFAGN